MTPFERSKITLQRSALCSAYATRYQSTLRFSALLAGVQIFCRSFLARRLQNRGCWPIAERVLKRNAGIAAMLNNIAGDTHTHVYVNPRLVIRTLSGGLGLRPLRRHVAEHDLIEPRRYTDKTWVVSRNRPPLSVTDDIVVRIATRSQRIERDPHRPGRENNPPILGVQATQPTLDSLPTVIPVTQILRQTHALASNSESKQNAKLLPDARDSVQAKTKDKSNGAIAPSVDIERLTEHVMQAIDRRIVVHRERLGRV